MNMEQFGSYIDAHQARFLDEFFALLRTPSVAAQNRGIDETVALVRQRLEQLGAAVQVFPVPDDGSPVVYATIGSGTKRLIIYDHYDVQPEDPIELWTSPPFEPTIRDGKIFARGAADNKGNLMLRIQAVEALLQTEGSLPLALTFVIEGEEEIGSPHLAGFCNEHRDLLAADGCLWETGGLTMEERPHVSCGAKGIQYVELVARGAQRDLHSMYAPIVPNPAWRLTWALATLKGPDGHVRVPGFYDSIRSPTEAEMQALATLPSNDDALLEDLGIADFIDGVRGTERLRRHLFDPTCTICGMVSGYTGQGAKTVLPNEARAKIDFRLVPDMEPEVVLQQLREHLDAQGYTDIEIINLVGVHPARSDLNADVVQAVAAAGEATYGVPAVLVPTMAGTGPMYVLGPGIGVPVVSGAGCSYHGTRIHAPDEHIRVDDYWNAMHWMGRFLHEFAAR
jgi:acetylornithine deacetylase/succinyl-diaminopimelate desuccinylase-like protein